MDEESAVRTEIVQLPNAQLTVEYKVTAGELLIAVLLTALIAVVTASWFYRAIFRKGG